MSPLLRVLSPILLLPFTLLTGCDNAPRTYSGDFRIFGSPSQVSIFGTGKAQAEAAIRIAELELERFETTWHAWKPGPMGFINQRFRAETGAFNFPEQTGPVITEAQRLALLSDHLFNPAIGGLKAAWGFQGADPATRGIPDKSKIEQLVAANPRMDDVKIARRRISGSNPIVQLDLGAFGAGYAVDRTLERLKQIGIANAGIRVGGITRVIGGQGEQLWRAAIPDPRTPDAALARITLADGEALALLSDTDQAYEADGRRIHPIIDPRTGYPAQGSRLAAVAHPDAATAAAAATAIFVAGGEEWYRIARRMGIHYALLIDQEGLLRMNPEMKARLKFDREGPPIRLSESLADAVPMELSSPTNRSNGQGALDPQPSDGTNAPPAAESETSPAGG